MSEAYRKAGVDLDRMSALKGELIEKVHSTWTRDTVSLPGSFAGLLKLHVAEGTELALLAATIDGVGTKALLAGSFNRWHVIGVDMVNHCLNDLLCAGAEPLFFLNYLATSQLDEQALLGIVDGMVQACRELNCPIIGGETALMPDVYCPGAVDAVGTMIGIVAPDRHLRPDRVRSRDVLVALPSSGLHTNGYSLVRKLFSMEDLQRHRSELGATLGEALLTPHRSYLKEVRLAAATGGLHSAAHITGGGIPGNLLRAVPEELMVTIDTASWEPPLIFQIIKHQGNLPLEEMFQVFNMGVGMVLIMDTSAAVEILPLIPEAWIMGEVLPAQKGKGRLQFER